jgi:hypothetical protein
MARTRKSPGARDARARQGISQEHPANNAIAVSTQALTEHASAITITITPSHRGGFDALIAGEVVARASATPLLEASRTLLERGTDPATILEMRHAGSSTVALRTRIGVAAGLTVAERSSGRTPPRFEPWKAPPCSAGSPPIAWNVAPGTGHRPGLAERIPGGAP